MRIPHSEWKWYGDPGHFICGRWCRFHLCTEVGEFLVSTVGRYVHPSHSKGSEIGDAEFLRLNPNGAEIGCDRFYETMVFRCGSRCASEACNCGMPAISGEELDFAAANTAGEATAAHMAMCLKVAAGGTE